MILPQKVCIEFKQEGYTNKISNILINILFLRCKQHPEGFFIQGRCGDRGDCPCLKKSYKQF